MVGVEGNKKKVRVLWSVFNLWMNGTFSCVCFFLWSNFEDVWEGIFLVFEVVYTWHYDNEPCQQMFMLVFWNFCTTIEDLKLAFWWHHYLSLILMLSVSHTHKHFLFRSIFHILLKEVLHSLHYWRKRMLFKFFIALEPPMRCTGPFR